jgi:hypothetical protein
MWRAFAGSNPAAVAPNSKLPEIWRALQQGRWDEAQFKVATVIHSDTDGYPSLFGAYSPDEDFVETFTLAVLLKAKNPLTDLILRFPGGKHADINVPVRGGGALARKIACFRVTG